MKTILRLILIVFFALVTKNTFAQIPNAGFENWVTVGNTTEPASWYSFYSLIDSTGNYFPVTKSTDHYPSNIGSYSARITNDTAIWNTGISPGNLLGWGTLFSTQLNDKPLFPTTGHPVALCGYYKFLPENGDTMNIDLHLYQSGVEITSGTFQSYVAAPSWTSFKVFVDDTLYSNVDSARIGISACNEPKDGSLGPLGNSVLYIDNLSFDNPLVTGFSQINEVSNVSVYPNPLNDKLTITFEANDYKEVNLNILNSLGQLVFTRKIFNKTETIDISRFTKGIYFARLTSDNQNICEKKIIIMK